MSMQPILAGIETEYGLFIEGRQASDQVDDAAAFVKSFKGACFTGWDYRYESPRTDLRGFAVERLQVDPVDAQFDVGAPARGDRETRADRVTASGARFYNDHGHPEYSTPECWSLKELVLHDEAGERLVQEIAGRASEGGPKVRVYKNNTDYHGASYGTHESYLVPRELGFDKVYRAVSPMLIARQLLCGAGKAGAETGRECAFQMSQRADFFSEPFNVETLYRRPVFNTRDEPHADPRQWMRLHVISGDSNMMAACTARKAGLVKIALQLALVGEAPTWRLADPVKQFQRVSRDESGQFRVDLESRNWTTVPDILESYFAAAEHTLDLDEELAGLIAECRKLLNNIDEDPEAFESAVDWAAKRAMLQQYMAEEGVDWNSPSLQALDLEYHNLDPDEGLFFALREMGKVAAGPHEDEVSARADRCFEPTRGYVRGLAVARFADSLKSACWRSVTFDVDGKPVEVELDPARRYPSQLENATDVETFIQILRGDP